MLHFSVNNKVSLTLNYRRKVLLSKIRQLGTLLTIPLLAVFAQVMNIKLNKK